MRKKYLGLLIMVLALSGCSPEKKVDKKEEKKDDINISQEKKDQDQKDQVSEKEDKKEAKEDKKDKEKPSQAEKEKKDKPDKKDPEKKEEKKAEKIISLKNLFTLEGDKAPKKEDYDYYYSDGQNTGEYTVIEANFDLGKISLVELEYDNDLKEKKVIKEFKLKKGEKLLINAVYPEGIPVLKLKWNVDGKDGEYIFQYDGKEGNPNIVEYKY